MSFERIVAFISEIGLPVQRRPLSEPTFLPGILIEAGGIVFDAEKLKHPGDLLHEAGHLAVIPAVERAGMGGNLQSSQADEMAAIAWSYAAALHLGIDPNEVFHNDGYQGGGSNIVENFQAGRYFGVPLLQLYGLTRQLENEEGEPVYPQMKGWLRA